ncbi:hypothetical protein EDB80DRAFT_880107 [Ilyonectria destructans]|nr:hypothetical protein EDB80DRAFT_880107 [Ilyonectria destructans]
MGRRALTAKEKADKLERERERAKKRRSEARPNNQADNIQPNLDDSNNTRLITCSSDPLPETVAEEDIIISSMPLLYNGDQRNHITLDPIDEQPLSITRRRSPRIANRPISTVPEPTTVANETDLRPEASAGPQASTRPIDKPTCPNPNHDVAAAYSAATYRSNAAGQDEREEISVVEIPDSDPSSSDEQPSVRPGRPRIDPAISPRKRTRLRVQRHRDQQHLVRAQQIVQNVAVTQELPPTVEFSALTLRDDSTPSSPPAQIQYWSDKNQSGPEPELETAPLPSSPTASPIHIEDDDGDDSESSTSDINAVSQPTTSAPLPRQDGRSSQPRNSLSSTSDSPDWFVPSVSPSLGPDDPILDGFLQAIHDQDTAGGPDFLRAQSDVYDRVLRTFFSYQCDCPNSHELAEPEHTHTLQERVERLGHSLPP